MITEKQFDTLIAALTDKIEAQEDAIRLKDWQIADLEKRLKEAEDHLTQQAG